MATFPKLKTGAVMQYPATLSLRYSSQVVRYVDGTEQRYRQYRAPLRQWAIRLDLLDETELAALEEFFRTESGQQGSFVFVDPADNVTYSDCSLGGDDFEYELREETRGKVSLIVRENRS